jgi:hypothetical protein
VGPAGPSAARHRGGPDHVPDPAHRLADHAGAAGRAHHGLRGAGGAAPAQPARCPGDRAHRHHGPAGLGRTVPAPREPDRRPGPARRRGRGDHRAQPRRDPLRGPAVQRAAGGGDPADRRGAGGRHAPGLHAVGLRRPGARRRRGGPVGLGAARARGARRVADPADGGRGAGPARTDQPALRLQLADRHRLVRAHRPRAGPRAAARVRRLHPLLVPPARGVHHARGGAQLDRAVPRAREGPLRGPARRHAADRPGGAPGGDPVPVPAAARRERRTPRARGQGRAGTDLDHRRGQRLRGGDLGRGRRRGRGPRAGTAGARRRLRDGLGRTRQRGRAAALRLR